MTKETLTRANDITNRLYELEGLKMRLDFNDPKNAERNSYLFFSGQTFHEAAKLSENMKQVLYGLVCSEICKLEAEFEGL